MATLGWGLYFGSTGLERRSAVSASIVLAGTSTSATHWTALSGGVSSTSAVFTDSAGRLPGFIEEGSYDLTIGTDTYRVEATAGDTLVSVASGVGQIAVNVKTAAYGAAGDGTTNDATAVQAAFDAANAAGGGTVLFPRGTYKINSARTLYSNLTLDLTAGAVLDFSAAVATTLMDVAGTEAAGVVLTANAVEGATSLTIAAGAESGFAAGDMIRVGSNLLYDPGRANQPIGEIAYVLSTASGTVTLRSGLVGGPYNTADTAFVSKITPVSNIKLKGGKILGGGASSAHTALKVTLGQHIRVVDTVFENVEATAVELRDVIDTQVRGVSVIGSNRANSGYGISFVLACQDSGVSGSYFRDCRHAASHAGVGAGTYGFPRRITWQGNHILDSASTGDALDTHAPCEDITFDNNHVYDATGSGINIECAKATVTNNKIWRAAAYGIIMNNYTNWPTEYVCHGNKVYSSTLNGIRYSNVLSTAGDEIRWVQIHDNVIEGCPATALYCLNAASWRAANVSIRDNTIRGCTNLTAALYLGKADNCAITGNTITDSPASSVGIRTADVTQTVISGNSVSFLSATSTTGIWLNSSGSGITVVGNTVLTANRGLLIDNGLTDCGVDANNFLGTSTPYALGTGARHVWGRGNVPAAVAPTTASATTVTLPRHAEVHTISGTTTITSITADTAGRTVVLIFSGILTLTDGSNLKLVGNFVTAAATTITLASDGTNWYELCRSVT